MEAQYLYNLIHRVPESTWHDQAVHPPVVAAKRLKIWLWVIFRCFKFQTWGLYEGNVRIIGLGNVWTDAFRNVLRDRVDRGVWPTSVWASRKNKTFALEVTRVYGYKLSEVKFGHFVESDTDWTFGLVESPSDISKEEAGNEKRFGVLVVLAFYLCHINNVHDPVIGE